MKLDKIIASVMGAIALFGFAAIGYGALTSNIPTQQPGRLQLYSFFSATTTNATSTNLSNGGGYLVTAGAKRVDLYFSRAWDGGNVGSSTFRIQVTPDGSNWYDYSQLRQVTDTYSSATQDMRVGTSTIIAATSTSIYAMDTLGFYGIRCIVKEVTDGSHTCAAQAEF